MVLRSEYSSSLPSGNPMDVDVVSVLALPPQAESRTDIVKSKTNSLYKFFI
jgi:hypothetical protein